MQRSGPLLIGALITIASIILGYAINGQQSNMTIIVTPIISVDSSQQSKSIQDVFVINQITMTAVPTQTPFPTQTPTVDIYEGLLPCYATEVAANEICAPIEPTQTPWPYNEPTPTPYVPLCGDQMQNTDGTEPKPRPCRKNLATLVVSATPTLRFAP